VLAWSGESDPACIVARVPGLYKVSAAIFAAGAGAGAAGPGVLGLEVLVDGAVCVWAEERRPMPRHPLGCVAARCALEGFLSLPEGAAVSLRLVVRVEGEGEGEGEGAEGEGKHRHRHRHRHRKRGGQAFVQLTKM
jgi:hypothetical protein